MKAQKLNQREAKWALYLSRFDFALKHVAGKSMERADSLSRRANWAEEVERDNENQMMLKREWLEIRAMDRKQWLIKRAKEDIIEKIKKLEVRDNEVIKAVEEMKNARVKILRNEKWQIKEDLMLKKEKIYVPKDPKLRLEIIQLHYNMLIGEYGGQQKIVGLVNRNYW